MRLKINATLKVLKEINLSVEDLQDIVEVYGSINYQNVLDYIEEKYGEDLIYDIESFNIESIETDEL